MKIKSATFAGSSTRLEQRPAERLPEVAFIGRSNVGKSSLINMLCGKKGLAMTSSTPGKTQLVNHFLINGSWYLVDLPGYGYARLPLPRKKALEEMIRGYITASPDLLMLFVLIDVRRDIGQLDMDFLTELGEWGIPFGIIFTKADKLGPVARGQQVERCQAQILQYWESLPPCFVTSSERGEGREELLNYLSTILKTSTIQ